MERLEIVKQVKWCDTSLACIPDITRRSLHFARRCATAPLPQKYLMFECIFLQAHVFCLKAHPVEYTSFILILTKPPFRISPKISK